MDEKKMEESENCLFFIIKMGRLILAARKTLAQASFLSVLDFGDIIIIHAVSSTLHFISKLSSTHITVYFLIWCLSCQ